MKIINSYSPFILFWKDFALKNCVMLFFKLFQMILGLLMPWQNQLKNQISEVLDIELIKQKIEHEVFDINYYEDYIISLMEKICAPVRDEDVAKLRHQKEVVSLFR